jgi:hypothetical protein
VKPYAFHPQAEAEYASAARYYADLDAELGGRFYDVIDALIEDICKQPDRFPRFDPPAS